MNKQQRFVLLILSVLHICPYIVSAQDSVPVSIGYFPLDREALVNWFDLPISVEEEQENINNVLFPNWMTRHYPMAAGAHTLQFIHEGETPVSYEVTFEAGQTYAVILRDIDQPPVVINQTVAEDAPLAEGENDLIIVTAANDSSPSFQILDNTSPTPRERMAYEYVGYLRSGISETGAVIQRLDVGTQEVLVSATIPYLPNTTVILNGDTLIQDDAGNPLMTLNFSTSLSVADWLTAVNQMANPPFTFNQFLNSAEVGGFSAALQQCEDYMWTIWTDAAFEQLSSQNQSFVSGAGAGVVVNNSVLPPATTIPWEISPTATRGGTPLTFNNAFDDADLPSESVNLAGVIVMTLSTTGNDVQNVVHITDLVPVGDTGQAPVSGISLTYDQAFFTLP
jgi:hypothetical protein